MDLPDFKALDKLAKACRKAGIRTFEGYGFKFTLDDKEPKKTRKSKSGHENPTSDVETEDTWDALSDEDKLFYSSVSLPESVLETK